MSLDFAIGEVERAVSILVTHPGRILDRLASARENALSHVHRDDIPEQLRERFDGIMAQLADVEALTEDDGALLAGAIENFTVYVDD